MITPITFSRDRVPMGQKATHLELLKRRLDSRIRRASYPGNFTYYVQRATEMPLRFGITVGGVTEAMFRSIVNGMKSRHFRGGWSF